MSACLEWVGFGIAFFLVCLGLGSCMAIERGDIKFNYNNVMTEKRFIELARKVSEIKADVKTTVVIPQQTTVETVRRLDAITNDFGIKAGFYQMGGKWYLDGKEWPPEANRKPATTNP